MVGDSPQVTWNNEYVSSDLTFRLPFKFTSNIFCFTPFVLDKSSRIVLTIYKKRN